MIKFLIHFQICEKTLEWLATLTVVLLERGELFINIIMDKGLEK